MSPDAFSVARLLASAGIAGEPWLAPLKSGGNNRVFRVDANGRRLFLKAYFHSAADPRDRLGAEWRFTSLAWQIGLRTVPRPIAKDEQQHLGLYEFVDGRQLEQAELTADRIDEAARFFAALNEPAVRVVADLAPASEAGFSCLDHLRLTHRSLERLGGVSDPAAARFVTHELEPCARAVLTAFRHHAGLQLETRLPRREWCVSPSDFGFHNALLRPDGRLCFIDFEYAGLDDPARMVADFFCQVQRPVAVRHLERFVAIALAGFEDQRERVRLLLPLYRLKWCCIVLNDFLPAGAARRRFAGEADSSARRAAQLAKAEAMLQPLAELSAA